MRRSSDLLAAKDLLGGNGWRSSQKSLRLLLVHWKQNGPAYGSTMLGAPAFSAPISLNSARSDTPAEPSWLQTPIQPISQPCKKSIPSLLMTPERMSERA